MLSGRSPFSRLVYPVPREGGLGLHITVDLAGQARFGPDVEWVDSVDYSVDPTRVDKFYEVVRGYRSEEHTSELQSLMRISYAVFCLKKKIYTIVTKTTPN